MSVGVSRCVHEQHAAVAEYIVRPTRGANSAVLVLKRLYCHAAPAVFYITKEIAVRVGQFFLGGRKPFCTLYQRDPAGVVEVHVAEIHAVDIGGSQPQRLEFAVNAVVFTNDRPADSVKDAIWPFVGVLRIPAVS